MCVPPLSKSQEQISNQTCVRVRRNINRGKWGPISSPVHRKEMTVKKNFKMHSKKKKKILGETKKKNAKYEQGGEAYVNLKLCRRYLGAEKTVKTDLYLVNILDYSSNVCEKHCCGCIGDIIKTIIDL